jgi:hypothetical protein
MYSRGENLLNKNKVDFGNRKVQQIRKSFLVHLPPEWIRSKGIKKSDLVNIVLLEDGSLGITPVPKVTRQDAEGTEVPTETTV